MMATPPDFSVGQVLTAAHMNAVGLWKITSASTTSTSNFIVDNCFSSTYTNYRLVFSELTGSGVTGLNFFYRDANGSVQLNNYYGRRQDFTYAAGTAGGASDAPSTAHQISAIISGNTTSPASLVIDVFAPNKNNRNTSITAQGVDARTGGGLTIYSGFYNAQTAMTGFVLNCGAQTWSNANVVVYGYRN